MSPVLRVSDDSCASCRVVVRVLSHREIALAHCCVPTLQRRRVWAGPPSRRRVEVSGRAGPVASGALVRGTRAGQIRPALMGFLTSAEEPRSRVFLRAHGVLERCGFVSSPPVRYVGVVGQVEIYP